MATPLVTEPIHVAFQPEASDAVRAYQLHNRDQLWRKPSLIALAVTLVIMGGFLVVVIDDWRVVVAILAGALVGGLLAPRMMIRWYVPRAARRIHAQQRSLQQPIDVVFEGEGLRTTTAYGTSFTPWSHYRKMREDQHVILFYQSDALFQFIPKRVLQREQAGAIRRLFGVTGGADRAAA